MKTKTFDIAYVKSLEQTFLDFMNITLKLERTLCQSAICIKHVICMAFNCISSSDAYFLDVIPLTVLIYSFFIFIISNFLSFKNAVAWTNLGALYLKYNKVQVVIIVTKFSGQFSE